MLTIKTKNNSKEMIIKMIEENPIVIDNHNGKEETITGLVEFANPNKLLACCFDTSYYSLNACMISDDNKLHCSMFSVGGVLWGAYPDAKQLKEYNAACLLESAKIKCIHRPDGTKVYPVN